jgi:hypothetical protein
MIASAIGATLALTLVPAGYYLTGTAGAAAALCAAEVAVLVITWVISQRLLFSVKDENFQLPEKLFDNAPEAVR